jgi:hypothetical protein
LNKKVRRLLLYLLHIFVLLFFAHLLWQQETSLLRRTTFLAAYFFKLICGIGLGLLYFNYYQGGDTISFHYTSVKLTVIGKESLSQYISILFAGTEELDSTVPELAYIDQPRAFFLVKLLSLLNFFTGSNYWINSLYFSSFSFWGTWSLSIKLIKIYPATKLAAIVAFLFYPSTTLWSAGVIKESLSIGAIGLLCSVFLDLTIIRKYDKLIKKAGLAILSAWLLFQLKFYFAAVLLPLLFVTAMALLAQRSIQSVNSNKRFITTGVLMLLLPVAFYAATSFHSSLNLHILPKELVSLYQQSQMSSDRGSVATFPNLEPTFISLVQHAPIAIITGLFRPLPYEASNTLQIAAALENTALLVASAYLFLVFLIKSIRSISFSSIKDSTLILIIATLIFVLVISWLLTLSFPNFGTQARYRAGYLPFYVYLVLSGITYLRKTWQARNKKG